MLETRRPSVASKNDRRFFSLRLFEEAHRLDALEADCRTDVDGWVARLMRGPTKWAWAPVSDETWSIVLGLKDSDPRRAYLFRATLGALRHLSSGETLEPHASSYGYHRALASLDDDMLSAVHYVAFGVRRRRWSRTETALDLIRERFRMPSLLAPRLDALDWDGWFGAWVKPWSLPHDLDLHLCETEAARLDRLARAAGLPLDPSVDSLTFHLGLCLGIVHFFDHPPVEARTLSLLRSCGVRPAGASRHLGYLAAMGLAAPITSGARHGPATSQEALPS